MFSNIYKQIVADLDKERLASESGGSQAAKAIACRAIIRGFETQSCEIPSPRLFFSHSKRSPEGVAKPLPESASGATPSKARLIGYLSAEGYVRLLTKNNSCRYMTKKGYKLRKYSSKYPVVYFYNENSAVLSQFQQDCNLVYGFIPKFYPHKLAINLSRINVLKDLLKYTEFGSLKWQIPNEFFESKELLSAWLQGFYDGEGGVESGKHNRLILSSNNLAGLNQVCKALLFFNIQSYINGPYGKCYRLKISDYDSILNFQKHINFFHSKRRPKLDLLCSKIRLHS